MKEGDNVNLKSQHDKGDILVIDRIIDSCHAALLRKSTHNSVGVFHMSEIIVVDSLSNWYDTIAK